MELTICILHIVNDLMLLSVVMLLIYSIKLRKEVRDYEKELDDYEDSLSDEELRCYWYEESEDLNGRTARQK